MQKSLLVFVFCVAILVSSLAQATTYTVDILTDENDTTCASGDCSLREAVRAANASSGADTIEFSASSGTYCLDAAYGGIRITDPLTITGKGVGATVIDANCGTSSADRIFWVNSAGGAVAFSDMTLTDGNVTGSGGAISVSGSTASAVTISNVVFDRNTASNNGGGVSCAGSANSVTLSNVVFDGNSAQNGGGLHSSSSCALTVSDTEFNNNQANTGGGLFCSSCTSSSQISQSLFSDNSSTLTGGGLYFIGSTFKLSNVTVTGSTAGSVGGGIRTQSTTLNLHAVTVAGNTASGGSGGGLYASTSSTLNIKSSILAGNTSTSAAANDCYISTGGTASTFTSAGSNLIDTGTCSYTKTTGDSEDVANINLADLADNGGNTRTLAIGTDSSAYGEGDCTALGSGSAITTDQRGFTRDSACDIGAFEYLPLWYEDADGDGYGNPAVSTYSATQPTGYVDNATDCDDGDGSAYGVEFCGDSIDNDCDGTIDESEGASNANTYYLDSDGDGYGSPSTTETACSASSGYVDHAGDCDDTNAAIHPGATEVCDDADVDEDCDGSADDASASGRRAWYADNDSDGYGGELTAFACSGVSSSDVSDNTDCDDSNAAVHPGASEICDASNTDENCDGSADGADASGQSTWYADADGDSYGDASATASACDQPANYVADSSDCNDSASAINPAATEVCDASNTDENCDGSADGADAVSGKSTWYADDDGDSYGDLYDSIEACDLPSGYVADSNDCNDTTATANPLGTEICDLIDNDCDNQIDEAVQTTYYQDVDGDGYGGETTLAACSLPAGYALTGTDCDDADANYNPAAIEVCGDSRDLNCDGSVGTVDEDGDGYFACAGGEFADEDCDDADADVHPGASEICDEDNLDEDCDGVADGVGASGQSSWYADVDGDFYGDPNTSVTACDQPTNYVADDTDCNDTDGSIKPGVPEVCDDANVDENCDGTADDSDATGQSAWYADNDGDTYGSAATMTQACDQPTGTVADDSDCDDTSASTYPGADEACGTSVDNNCDGQIVDADADDDGYLSCGNADCNDANAAIHPGATEVCDNVDNNCDGSTDESGSAGESIWYVDVDGDGYGDASVTASACNLPDGYVEDGSDCNDALATVHPGASEVCANGVNDDCDSATPDGTASTWFRDRDSDGYGNAAETVSQCGQPTAYVANSEDCNDTRSDIHPDVDETCDTLDNNCDDNVDEDVLTTYYQDSDADGFGDAASTTQACTLPSGFVSNDSDCNDADAALNPDTTDESCSVPDGSTGDDDDSTGDDDTPGDDDSDSSGNDQPGDDDDATKRGGGCALSETAETGFGFEGVAMTAVLMTLFALKKSARRTKNKA